MNRTAASTLTGVMLSAGSPSSELPSSGLMPFVIVPRVNAPDALSVSTPWRERQRRVRRQLEAADADVRVVGGLRQRTGRRDGRGQILGDEVRVLVDEDVGAARHAREVELGAGVEVVALSPGSSVTFGAMLPAVAGPANSISSRFG